MMKAKKLLSFLLLLSLFALWPAFSASADENAPEGNFELTATFKTNNVQITHEWYDSMDELWNELGPVAASDRYTEIKMHTTSRLKTAGSSASAPTRSLRSSIPIPIPRAMTASRAA